MYEVITLSEVIAEIKD